MSRSAKDGRAGGGHRKIRGEEFWSRRPLSNYGGCSPGKWAKRVTHKIERQNLKMETASLLEEIILTTQDQVDWEEFDWEEYEQMVWEVFDTGLWVAEDYEKEDI